jgi:hypothetical protein
VPWNEPAHAGEALRARGGARGEVERPGLLRSPRLRPIEQNNPRRSNPHSVRGTGVPHDSRVPSLEAFGRRPRCRALLSQWAGIRNLHVNRRDIMKGSILDGVPVNVRMPAEMT